MFDINKDMLISSLYPSAKTFEDTHETSRKNIGFYYGIIKKNMKLLKNMKILLSNT